jgi:hypothetical protein
MRGVTAKSLPVARLPAGGERHASSNRSGLMKRQVELNAIERGCNLLYLDTFSFQAPEFYYLLGYETACRLDGFPDGASKFVLRKSLIS